MWDEWWLINHRLSSVQSIKWSQRKWHSMEYFPPVYYMLQILVPRLMSCFITMWWGHQQGLQIVEWLSCIWRNRWQWDLSMNCEPGKKQNGNTHKPGAHNNPVWQGEDSSLKVICKPSKIPQMHWNTWPLHWTPIPFTPHQSQRVKFPRVFLQSFLGCVHHALKCYKSTQVVGNKGEWG